jgi:hypothetical protein
MNMNINGILNWICIALLLALVIPMVSAAPTAGAATAVSAGNFTVPVAGITGTDFWVNYGQYSGDNMLTWGTGNITASGAAQNVDIIGAPIIGESTLYYIACDATGCSAENSVVIPSITPLPQTTFGNALRNITQNRFNVQMVGYQIIQGYITPSGWTVFWGLFFFGIMLGTWLRTRSVRLIAILGICISPFIMNPATGLFLGIPLEGQQLASGLLWASLAGVLLSFIRR